MKPLIALGAFIWDVIVVLWSMVEWCIITAIALLITAVMFIPHIAGCIIIYGWLVSL